MNRSKKPGRKNPNSLAQSLWNAIRANGESLLGIVPRPRALCLYVTYECNLRCRTCGIWKQHQDDTPAEVSLAEIASILSDPLFSRLEYVNINGGEPTLRQDLAAIAALILERLPRLKALSLNSNGILGDRLGAQVRDIALLCKNRGISFSVSISLHAPGPLLDEICGLPGTWDRVHDTLHALQQLRKSMPFFLSTNCVLSALNAHVAEAMADWSRREGIPVNFVLAEVRERFGNEGMADDFSLNREQKPAVSRFFRHLSREEPFLYHHRMRYRVLADMLEFDRPRRLACHYRMGGAILGSRGELFYCKFSREIGNCRNRSPLQIYYDPEQLRYRKEELLGDTCAHCLPNTLNRIELEKDIFRYLAFLLRSQSRRKPDHGRL